MKHSAPAVLQTVLPFVNFVLMDQCTKCQRFLYTEEVLSGWKRSYNEYTTSCHGQNCTQEFVPHFKVIEYQPEAPIKETFVQFLSPLLIKKEIENLIKLHEEGALFNAKFEEEHNTIYWNCILYSQLIKAPTFFFEKPQSKEYIQKNVFILEQNLAKRYTQPQTSNTLSITAQIKEYMFNSGVKVDPMGISKSPGSRNSTSSSNGKPNNANHKIKKVFSTLFAELKVSLEKRLTDYEHEKAVPLERSDSNSMNVADINDSNLDPPRINIVRTHEET